MIKKAQNNAPPKPRAAVLTPADLIRAAGGDPGSTKIRETVVAD